jgi:uncharacterized protein
LYGVGRLSSSLIPVMIPTFAILFALIIVWCNGLLQTTSLDVQSHRLPASFDGYCIVQVSDLHGQRFGLRQVRLFRAIREARPDLIVITGDLTSHGRWDAGGVRDLVEQLGTIAPVCFISGNHDNLSGRLPQLLEQLALSRVRNLEGDLIPIKKGTESILLSGIPDPRTFALRDGDAHARRRWEAALRSVRDRISPDQYSILLSHRPEPFRLYADLGFDLVLAGHAHGGQIRLPGIGALYAPDQGWLPRYTSRVYASGRTKMIVSRGLGNSWFKVRLFNRPELVVVRLRKSAD